MAEPPRHGKKLDKLLTLIAVMKQTQAENQREMSQKLEQVECDVHTGQDVVAKRVVKKFKRDRGYEFQKKGREKQYLFNDDIKDKLDSAAAMVAEVTPANVKDKEALDNATKELKEGVNAILVCQKLIHLANCSEFGWDTMNKYETNELASNEDNVKRLIKAEKAAKQKPSRGRKLPTLGEVEVEEGSVALRWDSYHPHQVVVQAVQCSH